jgi:hypothetical protein
MHRLMLVSAASALLCLTSATGSAAPTDRATAGARAPAITLVEGWWEQENRGDAADRYWQLNRNDRRRYDQTETRIQTRHKRYHLDQYDHRDDRDLTTQRRILHYETHQ